MFEMLEWVIVIEFDPLVRALLVEWLEEIRPGVLSFDGRQVLPAVGASLVVVDLGNDRRQGADNIRRLRTLYPGVPLLGLSTQAREGIAAGGEAARRLGVDMLLPKPCERELLLQAARTLMAVT
ncbi:DNA-binding transcriptional response regulator [Hylemonella gracilis]|uniref:Response regulator receiver n=1 Tax=Hylemonella gracilis ATCC 19624 TaxID=887062 RepID=F3KPT8_9BURK|nr:response regulator [Hylemonella gracilis]EGI78106.1 response regulator receiver [Hylemonella gracilis ATCC 19624]